MSRFAIPPQQLLYLPPTMSPSATSALPGLLEHPAEAFAYYRSEGISHLVCQEKHMGSRAVALVRRSDITGGPERPASERGAFYAYRTGVLQRPHGHDRLPQPAGLRRERRRPVRRPVERLVAARRGTAAVVGEGG